MSKKPAEKAETKETKEAKEEEKQYTMSKVKRKVKKGRLLIVLFDGVYDFTDFAEKHPGGKKVLYQHRGKNASDTFLEAGHIKLHYIVQELGKYRVGKLVPEAKL